MKEKRLSRFCFVALGFLVVSVNFYAQIAAKNSLRLEGSRQIIAGAKRWAKNGRSGPVGYFLPAT